MSECKSCNETGHTDEDHRPYSADWWQERAYAAEAKLELAVEGLQLIDMLKEGFPEDTGPRALKIAWETLKSIQVGNTGCAETPEGLGTALNGDCKSGETPSSPAQSSKERKRSFADRYMDHAGYDPGAIAHQLGVKPPAPTPMADYANREWAKERERASALARTVEEQAAEIARLTARAPAVSGKDGKNGPQ